MPGDSYSPSQQWPIEPIRARRGQQIDDDEQRIDGQVDYEVDLEPEVV